MHGGKCYDIKMMKAAREERARKINNFFRLQDAFLFILFVLSSTSPRVRAPNFQFNLNKMPFDAGFSHSINVIELNRMHETNKIELKLIEVDACSYLGLPSIIGMGRLGVTINDG